MAVMLKKSGQKNVVANYLVYDNINVSKRLPDHEMYVI
ncbi:hypothetical protein SAMN05421736_11564 [Evansella caseinilytica]|uniref:Uncharacterized protein n=1 Tax=Evansella caseinilytica TaxID=1503961 RepID=A0A1H3TLW8_9BACI|nr:hypothetical protein SAMN05421736_11564 [Evansella caseinilytica]